MRAIDLNADLGEGMGDDAAMLDIVTSANVACGLHAGDAATMRRTAAACAARAVAVGAHVSFDDRSHFGRREMVLGRDEVTRLVLGQLEAMRDCAAAVGTRLRHVKPHGALYNMAARDHALAAAIAAAVRAFDPALALFGLSGSASIEEARRAGLTAVSEVFADRGYRRDGSLVPRNEPGALIDMPAAVARRAVEFAQAGHVQSVDGDRVAVQADTICMHGDTPGAVALARAVREALEAEGFVLRCPGA